EHPWRFNFPADRYPLAVLFYRYRDLRRLQVFLSKLACNYLLRFISGFAAQLNLSNERQSNIAVLGDLHGIVEVLKLEDRYLKNILRRDLVLSRHVDTRTRQGWCRLLGRDRH